LFSGIPIDRELETRPGIAVVLLKTVLSVINCDAVPRPSEVSSGYVVRTIISALVLAGGLYATLRSDATRDVAKGQPRDFTGAHKFAVAWAILAWLPLVLPSIAWHAYYGCLGALGAWFAVALWLRQFPSTAVGLVVVLCILRGAQASTPSWNWGDEWYQRRAGNLLESIRRDLIRLHPTLPSHSRVFFGHIPNNIGLIAGQSPALRVWYRDSTLQAGFYSSYAPRVGSARNGTDYFFRFDSLDGMVEVRKGPENIEEGKQANPDWEADHEKLAMLFLSNGDVPGAAVEFEKLSRLPERADAASYAAVCYLVLGDSIRADSLAGASAIRLGLSRAEMEQRLAALRASMPGR
jgi:hypothetical protein